MYKGFLHTHILVVTLFLLLYVIKTILLLSNRTDLLQKFSKMFKIPEMIISTLFLITGIYLATQLPFGSKYDYLFWIKLVMVFASIPIAIIGFKKSNKILAALSLLLITGSYGLAEVYGKKKAIIAVDANAAIANDGIALYEANCKLCHGADGKLAMAGAKDLSATTMDVAAIKEIILKGKSTMPPAPVNDEQAQMIADYVHSSLKGK
ncbi:MAG: SirB2 family protein [Sphingobacteriaceae bacterium]|nr:SirB2 family protein [Sphingobacteriaceae bacterium]MBK7817626.1 SirB2 family protein [Sphingobacteriaceae bacterium]